MDVLASFQALLLERHPVAHNLHYDIQVLHRLGLELPNTETWNCTLTLAKLGAPRLRKFGLKDLAVRLFDESDADEDTALKTWCKQQKPRVKVADRFLLAPQSLLSIYCAKDVYLAAKLWARFSSQLDRSLIYQEYRNEMKVLARVVAAEQVGMRLDLGALKSGKERLDALILDHTAGCYRLAGYEFLTNSPKQLAKALYGTGLPALFTKKGAASTSKVALLTIRKENKLADRILKLRHAEKLLAYLEDYEHFRRGDTLSGVFNTLGALTGRFSCSNPNLQNIPRPDEGGAALIRALFIPRAGRVLVAADFSQIELRVGALYADPQGHMAHVLNSGGDIHQETSELIGHSRQIAKSANFLLIYCGTADKLQAYLALFGTYISLGEARAIVAAFHGAYPEFRRLAARVEREVNLDGGVTDLVGRFYPVPRGEAYKGVNYLVQGLCAKILKGAIVRLGPVLDGEDAHMVSFIHDEILIDASAEACALVPNTTSDGLVTSTDGWAAPEDSLLGRIRAAMEERLHPAICVETPVEVSVCPVNWARKNKVKVWN